MREIEELKQDLEIQKTNKEKREVVLQSKIQEINNAMNAIQKISETAPSPQEQS